MPTILRFDKVARPAVHHPGVKAAMFAGGYVVLCGAYIIISGYLASAQAATAEQLYHIEVAKGIVFVTVTGALFFFVSWAWLRRIRRQEQTMIAQERSLLIGEQKAVAAMCAGILAHDLNNLLLSLQGLVQGLKGREHDDDFLAAMRCGVEHSITSLSQLAKRFMVTAGHALPDAEDEVNIPATLARLVDVVRKHPGLASCVISLEAMPAVTLRLNPVLFEEAILNLLVNAGQAAGPRGRVVLRCRREDHTVSVEVHDNGPGVARELEEMIFTPCFTTKADGTGLGLLAVKTLATSCNGAVVVDRSELGGAVFALRMPDGQASSSGCDAQESQAP